MTKQLTSSELLLSFFFFLGTRKKGFDGQDPHGARSCLDRPEHFGRACKHRGAYKEVHNSILIPRLFKMFRLDFDAVALLLQLFQLVGSVHVVSGLPGPLCSHPAIIFDPTALHCAHMG